MGRCWGAVGALVDDLGAKMSSKRPFGWILGGFGTVRGRFGRFLVLFWVHVKKKYLMLGKANKTDRNETKQNDTKRNGTKRNEANRNETMPNPSPARRPLLAGLGFVCQNDVRQHSERNRRKRNEARRSRTERNGTATLKRPREAGNGFHRFW